MVDLRKNLAEERQALRLAYLGKPEPQLLLRRHCALVDRTIREVWRDSRASRSCDSSRGRKQ